MFNAVNEAEALEVLHQSGCTDGLPVVIPTRDRVDRLVLASGLDSDVDLGAMGPGGGAATVEKLAINAVMAGCLPDQMAVVLAAVRAILQPAFDLGEMQSTTHSTAPLMIVNGPVVRPLRHRRRLRRAGPGSPRKRIDWSRGSALHDEYRRSSPWRVRYGAARSPG